MPSLISKIEKKKLKLTINITGRLKAIHHRRGRTRLHSFLAVKAIAVQHLTTGAEAFFF